MSRLLRDIAIQRMYILLELGVTAVERGRIEYAKRYGELIKRISMRCRVDIPRSIKRWICKNCNVIMVPGSNARVRSRRKGKTLRVVTTCLVCGWMHRYEFTRCRKSD
ncbi:MAG: ribonuclease P [Ignisphaera sp.]|nr:ribonuclease P [Ignisphaera sp.]MCX8168311.1 ribonuclease P [Ignisphaera sp.]MDW8085357.1 ribonuclease P [Ignisphaera sp.]